jgi:uncharacterized protein (TIGR01244 family)
MRWSVADPLMGGQSMIDLESLKEIPNIVLLQEDVIGGGTPTQEALEEIKRQGFRTVVDLRTLMEGTPFMKKSVKKLGMNYYNIPIQGLNINEKQVTLFSEILADSDNRPVLVHCAIGGRVTALWDRYKAGQ